MTKSFSERAGHRVTHNLWAHKTAQLKKSISRLIVTKEYMTLSLFAQEKLYKSMLANVSGKST